MNTLPQFATPQLQLLHRGKVRDSFRIDDSTRLIVVSDRLSAFDSVLETAIPNKGAVLH
jgi:phosphoribosylaminoimidazole-succinocarboxamide synthase